MAIYLGPAEIKSRKAMASNPKFYTRGLLYDSKTNSVFLYKRNGSDQWTMFGGTAEDNETPEECLIRETKEELALDLRKFRIKLFEHRLDKGRDSERYVYYIECDQSLVKEILEDHADYKWISLEEILNYDLTEHTRRDLEFFRRTRSVDHTRT